MKLNTYTIVKAASKISGKPMNLIRSKTRVASVVLIRDLCIKLCKETGILTDRDISPYFNRDRSTITHALSRVEDNLEQLEQYRIMLDDIKNELNICVG